MWEKVENTLTSTLSPFVTQIQRPIAFHRLVLTFHMPTSFIMEKSKILLQGKELKYMYKENMLDCVVKINKKKPFSQTYSILNPSTGKLLEISPEL